MATSQVAFDPATSTIRSLVVGEKLDSSGNISADAGNKIVQGSDAALYVGAPQIIVPVYSAASIATTGLTPTTARDIVSITLPSIGTWKVEYSVYGQKTAVTLQGLAVALYSATNALVPNSEMLVHYSANASVSSATSSRFMYLTTTTLNTVVKLRAWGITKTGATVLNNTTGRTFLSAIKI